MHTVDSLIFEEQLVVFRDGDKEQNGGDVLKAMDPLLTLGTLTTDVEHAVGKIANDEGSLGDTGRLDTGAENILVVGNVVRLSNAVYRVEVAMTVVSGEEWRARQMRQHTIWQSR